MEENCLFCKIANKQIPTERMVYEDDEIAAFPDIHPKAEIHILIVPKKHIVSVDELTENDSPIIGKMILVAKKLAKENNINDGYRLIINAGKFQEIKHIHLHLLGGTNSEKWPEFYSLTN